MAEDEGFEPPQTESESGVLPLHKSSMRILLYPSSLKSQEVFSCFAKKFPGPKLLFPKTAVLFCIRFPGEGISGQNIAPDIGKGAFFAFLRQHVQQKFQLSAVVQVHQLPLPAGHEIIIGGAI